MLVLALSTSLYFPTSTSVSSSPFSFSSSLTLIFASFIGSNTRLSPPLPPSLSTLFPKEPICFTLTDDMDSSQNWLGFSLSNHHRPSDSSQFCLFEAFNTTNSGVGDKAEDGTGSTDLSILTGAGGPKLEDFLGGRGKKSSTGAADVSQFSGETPTSLCTYNEIYDSDLKTIAAGFLHGY